jgi:dihydrofolate reductase
MPRTLAVNTFLSLDGVMQAPGGPQEDPTGGFTEGGWSVGYWDDAMGEVMQRSMDQGFELLLGRRTYEIFAAHWPHVSEEARTERGGDASPIEDPAADALNNARKWVASRTLDEVTWTNSVLLEGDAAEAVRALKEQDGPEIQVHGSANLIQTLTANGLVDEYRIWTFPVVVGGGKRLFEPEVPPMGLRLVESTAFDTGVVRSTYAPAGEIERGSFAYEEPTPDEAARRERLAAES